MDIFLIEAIVRELSKTIVGARINKVFQPTATEIIIRLWTGRENLRLLLSASSQYPRIHITQGDYPNPFSPPRFCQLLRSRLSALTGIEQIPRERIVKIAFSAKEGQRYILYAELTGRHANLMLTDEKGKIVDALKRVDGKEEGRRILPGELYQLPASAHRLSLEDAMPPADCRSSEDFRKWLLAAVSPMSPLVARDLAAQVEKGGSPFEVLARLRQRWLEKDFQPQIALLDGKKILSPFALEGLSTQECRLFSSASEAADAFYYESSFALGEIGDKGQLCTAVKRGLKKLDSRIQKIEAEQKKAEDFDSQRKLGELLLANMHLLSKGMEEVTVQDYYSDPPEAVTISLDPRLSPQQNAELYFKGFKKGKRGVSHVARRLEETREEMEWLENVALALDEAEDPNELATIRQELEEAGIVKRKAEPFKRKQQGDPREQVRKMRTPGGYQIYWGKNNKTNDHVSKHMTSSNDLWFHVHNMPGCHLVLKKGDNESVPEEDILFAASVAAFHSRGKNDQKVEVMVAEGKYVGKPKGARPGLVTVSRYRTVVVQPHRLES